VALCRLSISCPSFVAVALHDATCIEKRCFAHRGLLGNFGIAQRVGYYGAAVPVEPSVKAVKSLGFDSQLDPAVALERALAKRVTVEPYQLPAGGAEGPNGKPWLTRLDDRITAGS
jgi:hypothetical protein